MLSPGPALMFWVILFIDISNCFLLFVLHIMMQLWCWQLMIYLTSWCCSDVGNFYCFLFLISWSISDDWNVQLCPWASSAVLLISCPRSICYARCFVFPLLFWFILFIGPALLFWFIIFIDIWICFLLFVLHIMMQLWCWKLMIYLTSWCCSDVGNFHCFFVFLISWSISDDGNVLLCPWASSAVLLMCLIDFLSKKHCYARCFVLWSTVHLF